MKKTVLIAAIAAFSLSTAFAQDKAPDEIKPAPPTSITIPMYKVYKEDGNQPVLLGDIVAEQTKYGVLFKPNLKDIPAGIHGFHVHENPSCGHNGADAGGHFDPKKTGAHLGPYNDAGHLGDLPVLIANKEGLSTLPVLAPRLTLNDLRGHSLMIHMDGDNYADMPEKLGGGGARYACGVIGSK